MKVKGKRPSEGPSFSQRIQALIKSIPKGKVATYGQIAALAGNPRASRLVVWILNSFSQKEKLPWHRVINSKGRISLKPSHGYEIQKMLLLKDEIKFEEDDSIDLKRYLWKPIKTCLKYNNLLTYLFLQTMKDKDLVQQMNIYYAKRAPLHDNLMGYSDNAQMEELLAPIIRRLEKYLIDQEVLEIACGTGNGTQILAKRASSVLATDINSSVLEIAKRKSYPKGKVTFKIADAYALQKIEGKFTTAFAADWWSHIPRSMIPSFLEGLHKKLHQGARVIFVDMLPSESLNRMFSHYDKEGNLIHKRSLPDGEEFYVVKNFPTEKELRNIFDDMADDFEFYQHLPLKRWMLTYTKK